MSSAKLPTSTNDAEEQPKKRRRICNGSEILTSRICNGSEILTSLEYVKQLQDELEDKINVKNSPKPRGRPKKVEDVSKKDDVTSKKLGNKKKKPTVVSESSSDESDILEELSDELEETSDEGDDSITVVKDDYVEVAFNGTRYPGQVTEVGDNEVKVKHMEKMGQNWRWPKKKDDILTYEAGEIIRILAPPTAINKRGLFCVPEIRDFVSK